MFRLVFLISGLMCVGSAQSAASEGPGPLYTISTIAGIGPQDQSKAFWPETLSFDGAGNLYIGDISGSVHRVTPSGTMITIAGPGVPGFSADGANGTIQLGGPLGVAADASKSVYIADTSHNRVLKLTSTGTVTTFAGTGTAGSTGDGGPASAAEINQPFALAIDRLGNVYIGEYGGARVRKVTPDGTISTIAGNGQFGTSGDGGPATSARIADMGIAVDKAGNLYIADGASLVRKVGPDGVISTVAGGGKPPAMQDARPLNTQDGLPATAAWLFEPNAVAVDDAGNLYISDGWFELVRKVTPDGIIHTVAGTATAGYLLGPGRNANTSQLNYPSGVAVDAGGNLYIADFLNSVVRKVDAQGKISVFVSAPIGDGGPATSASLMSPTSLTLDVNGNTYVNDGSGRIRKIDENGIITTVAGTGEQGFVADGVSANNAPLNSPGGLAVGVTGDLFIADTGNHRVRKVGMDGLITTVAGSKSAGFSGDGGPAASAQLSSPSGVAVDSAGNLYIADTGNNRVRKVTIDGRITTIAGNGAVGYGGDGGPATDALLSSPSGVAVDAAGDVYVVDTDNLRIREVTKSGVIKTIAGTGVRGESDDGGPAAAASLTRPVGVVLDSEGDLFIADSRVRRIRPDGTIGTVAGYGQASLFGETQPRAVVDGAPAFLMPVATDGIAIDSRGNLYFADAFNGWLRKGTIIRSSGVGTAPRVLPDAVVNAANLLPGPVSPGEVVTLFGTDLGPRHGISAAPNTLGKFATELAGIRVLFDGIPAPVLYAQSYQINAIVPFGVAIKSGVQVQVESSGLSNPVSVTVADAAPAILTIDPPSPRGGRGAVINQDGAINSPSHPAPMRSVISIYATGAGQMQPALSDGQIATGTLAKPALPVSVMFWGAPGKVDYAGQAPGMVAGLLQINVRVPDLSCGGQFCFDPNALPIYMGLGAIPGDQYSFGKYVSTVLATVAVCGNNIGTLYTCPN